MIALDTTLFDFGEPQTANDWGSISDRVMGGVSTAELVATRDGTAVFRGEVSLENNGGFASIRSMTREYDLRDYRALALDLRGDGRRYKINIKTDGRFDGVLYRTAFDTEPDRWTTVTLPFRDFLPTLRGRLVPAAPPLDLQRIRSIGLMVSDRPGTFRLEIRSIRAGQG